MRPDGGDCAPVDDAVFIGGPEKREIVIEDYDPAWTARFEQVDAALRQALPDARRIEHFGSTAVPGLGAKGIVDVLVTVDDADDESTYAPALERAGVHVYSEGSDAARTRLLFRDWLRHNPEDRRLYEDTKRELARREWEATNDYSTAKGAVVAEILGRAQRWAG